MVLEIVYKFEKSGFSRRRYFHGRRYVQKKFLHYKGKTLIKFFKIAAWNFAKLFFDCEKICKEFSCKKQFIKKNRWGDKVAENSLAVFQVSEKLHNLLQFVFGFVIFCSSDFGCSLSSKVLCYFTTILNQLIRLFPYPLK